MPDILHKVGIKSSSLDDVYTALTRRMDRHDDWTIILFKHEGWREPVKFMHHCSTKWAVFLLSLKSLLETRKGAPYPNEIKLDSWE